jgi:glutamate dehydrogenase (NAD(P)+)
LRTVLEYRDEVYGTPGWLVYDDQPCRLAAGGCRVQGGITEDTVAMLASRMTLKQRVVGTNVGGAKAGLDLDPSSPHKGAVIARFLQFLGPELMTRFSMGCDMGTTMSELEALARTVRIPSIKYAITAAQDMPAAEFFARMRVLDEPVGLLTVGQLRSGHALAHTALSIANNADWPEPYTVALQGFGTLGRGAAHSLLAAGARIVAIADEYGCVSRPGGLDVTRMLLGNRGTPVPELAPDATLRPREQVLDAPVDLLILAAGEKAIPAARAVALPCGAVVVGANYGLEPHVERLLAERGVIVVPDFIGGIGGSASMEVLFGAVTRPTPTQLLATLANLIHALVRELLDRSRLDGVTIGDAAHDIARHASASPTARPYGNCPYIAAEHSRPPVTAL